MKKLLGFLYKVYCKRTLKKLSKIACVLKSDPFVKYLKPGEKTYARFKPMQTIYAAMGFVYGREWEKLLKVTGFKISENETEITVDVYSVHPGCVIGKMGSLVDELKKVLENAFGEKTNISLHEVVLPMGIGFVNMY